MQQFYKTLTADVREKRLEAGVFSGLMPPEKAAFLPPVFRSAPDHDFENCYT
jgi:hypothetical protein